MFKRILVPLDGSSFAERALFVAEDLAASTGADLTLLRVVEVIGPGEREPGVVSYLDEQRIAAAQDYLTQAAGRLRLGRSTSQEACLAPDAVTGIVERVRDAGADLVVMSSHGVSWPAASLLGATAAKLAREAPCPVLVVGPRSQVTDLQAAERTGEPA